SAWTSAIRVLPVVGARPGSPLDCRASFDHQVLPLAPAVHEAVEVAPGQAVALLLVEVLPEAVLVADDRQAGDHQGTATIPIAQPEAQLEVGQPVEAKSPVEAIHLERLGPPQGQDVALYRVHLRPWVGVEVAHP